MWPLSPPIIGTVSAPLPAADDVTKYRGILLDAYSKACQDVTDVQSAMVDFEPRSLLIDVRCPGRSVVGVRLIYAGAVVPNVRCCPGMNEPRGILFAHGLRLRIVYRHSRKDEQSGIVVQRPAAGSVVPFGTVVTVVYGR